MPLKKVIPFLLPQAYIQERATGIFLFTERI